MVGDVTNGFPGSRFVYVLHCDQVCISSRFQDIAPQTLGHDLDLSID